MPRFYRIFGIGDGHEEIAINFEDYLNGGIPCLPANYSSEISNCRSYLCTIPGNVLADLYDEYGSRMLEGNVRSFLGKRGVNKDIRNTVLNEPDMFFVYNNGLSATATEAIVKGDRLVFARDLQIVNGGQTTATLSSTRHTNGADLSKINLAYLVKDGQKVYVPNVNDEKNINNITESIKKYGGGGQDSLDGYDLDAIKAYNVCYNYSPKEATKEPEEQKKPAAGNANAPVSDKTDTTDSKANATTSPTKKADTTTANKDKYDASPETADNTNFALPFILMISSVGVTVVAAVIRKKREY